MGDPCAAHRGRHHHEGEAASVVRLQLLGLGFRVWVDVCARRHSWCWHVFTLIVFRRQQSVCRLTANVSIRALLCAHSLLHLIMRALLFISPAMQVIAKASKTLAHDKALGIAEVNVLKVMLQFRHLTDSQPCSAFLAARPFGLCLWDRALAAAALSWQTPVPRIE